ncbi:MAG: hypothetical protein ACW98Y_19940 [Candidatus Thorarchaeota archaeon]|jgi:hypothetical protein
MGKGFIFKIMSYGIIAGVALVLGTQILSSVSWVVVSLRLGNIVPFSLVVVVTLLLQRIAASVEAKSPVVSTLVDISAWASVIYLFFVLLVGLIPFGILIAIAAAGLSVVGCMIVRDPSDLKEKLILAADMATAYRGAGLRSGPDRDSVLWSYLQRQSMEVLQLPRGSFETVTTVLKDRPMLPVALIHFDYTDFLIIRDSKEVEWIKQVKRVLHDAGVFDTLLVPTLLRKAILLMPILDEHDGLKTSDYVLAVNKKSVQVLLDHRPERMIVFPHSEGLRIVVRRESVPGIEVESIPSDLTERIIVGREHDALSSIVIQPGGESTAH